MNCNVTYIALQHYCHVKGYDSVIKKSYITIKKSAESRVSKTFSKLQPQWQMVRHHGCDYDNLDSILQSYLQISCNYYCKVDMWKFELSLGLWYWFVNCFNLKQILLHYHYAKNAASIMHCLKSVLLHYLHLNCNVTYVTSQYYCHIKKYGSNIANPTALLTCEMCWLKANHSQTYSHNARWSVMMATTMIILTQYYSHIYR